MSSTLVRFRSSVCGRSPASAVDRWTQAEIRRLEPLCSQAKREWHRLVREAQAVMRKKRLERTEDKLASYGASPGRGSGRASTGAETAVREKAQLHSSRQLSRSGGNATRAAGSLKATIVLRAARPTWVPCCHAR
jgi:hypothetical protein